MRLYCDVMHGNWAYRSPVSFMLILCLVDCESVVESVNVFKPDVYRNILVIVRLRFSVHGLRFSVQMSEHTKVARTLLISIPYGHLS